MHPGLASVNASDRVVPTVTGSTLRPGGAVRLDGHAYAWTAPPSLAAEPLPALNDERLLGTGLTRFAATAAPHRAALLDCQAPGSGRDAAALARVSRASGVAIAALTGFHRNRAYPLGLRPWTTVDAALATFLRELEGGFREAPMARAAGLVAAFTGIVEDGDPCWEAAVEACRATGALLVVHTDAGSGIEDLVPWLATRDVPLDRVYLLGSDRRGDAGLLVELARAGVLLGVGASLRGDASVASLERLLAEGLGDALAAGLGLTAPEQWRDGVGPDAPGGPAALVAVLERRVRELGAAEDDVEALMGGSLLARLARPEVALAARPV